MAIQLKKESRTTVCTTCGRTYIGIGPGCGRDGICRRDSKKPPINREPLWDGRLHKTRIGAD